MIIDRGDGSTCSILFTSRNDRSFALFQVRLRFLDSIDLRTRLFDSIFLFPSGDGEGGEDSSTRDLLIESIERSKYNGVHATNSRACVCTAAVWETKKVNGDGIKDEGTSETRR